MASDTVVSTTIRSPEVRWAGPRVKRVRLSRISLPMVQRDTMRCRRWRISLPPDQRDSALYPVVWL